MGTLNHFDDRTIQRVRDRFTGGDIGSGDDPIATHTKMIQDHYLENLEKLASRAENRAYGTNDGLQGEVDTHAEIDPTLSYEENVALLKDDLNVQFRTEAKRADRDAKADETHKQRRFAAQTIRENFDAIEAGEKSQLVEDISAEISEAFVNDVLAVERAERASDTGSLPDPEPEPTPEPTPAPSSEPTVEATPEPEPEPEPEPVSSATVTDEPPAANTKATPTPTPEPTPGPATETDYSGIVGSIRLVISYLAACFATGNQPGEPTDKQQQATFDHY